MAQAIQTTDKPLTEQERRDKAMELLADVGGALSKEEDITFEGTKFVIPEHLDLDEAVTFLKQRRDDDEGIVAFSRTFNYRPHDGARATGNAIKEAFGFTVGKTVWTFFGPIRPELIDVAVSHDEVEQVPWGHMKIPGMENTTLQLGATRHKDYGNVYRVSVEAPRKYRHHIEGLFQLIEKHLKEDSIYRAKAIDGDGNFIDTSTVDKTKLVYSESVQRRLEGDLWSFIQYEDALKLAGQDNKYAVLLEGPFGSGKTEAAGVTAQIANAHGWTFITCRPGRDNLSGALEMAKLYPPAVVFAEDIDTEARAGEPSQISQMLDMMDGFHTKGRKLITVFTTNNAEKITAGMLRPGRIGAVIHIGAMDRPGVEKLAQRVIGDNLAPNIDWDAVYEAMEGYRPAFVKEAFNRCVRYSIAANDGKVLPITTIDLVTAAQGLRDQLALMEAAPREQLNETLSNTLGAVVQAAMYGTHVVDYDGDKVYELAAANAD